MGARAGSSGPARRRPDHYPGGDRGAYPSPTIGDRILLRRKARGWTIRYAADRAGISHTTWSRIESGRRGADNRFTLADIAAALECSTTDLTGMAAPTNDPATTAAQAGVYAIRQALIDIDLAEPGTREPRSMPELEQEALLPRDLWARCDYAGAGRLLPPLLRELHSATGGPDRSYSPRPRGDPTPADR